MVAKMRATCTVVVVAETINILITRAILMDNDDYLCSRCVFASLALNEWKNVYDILHSLLCHEFIVPPPNYYKMSCPLVRDNLLGVPVLTRPPPCVLHGLNDLIAERTPSVNSCDTECCIYARACVCVYASVMVY